MREIRYHLKRLQKIKKHIYHPLIHKIYKKHRISKKTLFYIKEYGPHSHVPRTIIRESIKVLLLASLISSFGGLAIENIKTLFISIAPLVILLPSLNDMVGDYGTIISSKFSTMLHEGIVKTRWWKEEKIKKLFMQVILIALITTIASTIIAMAVHYASSLSIDLVMAGKVFLIAIIDVMFLVFLLFFVSIFAGLHLYKKKEDPNNFLIPITTSVADFGNMVILALLVSLFF